MKKKLFSILLPLVMVVTMIPMATMTSFAVDYTYELPEGIQVLDNKGNPIPSYEEMGEDAPWRVLRGNIYIRKDNLVIKGSVSTSTMIFATACNNIILEGLSGPISLEAYSSEGKKSIEITCKGNNELERIVTASRFVVINGDGTLTAESINVNGSALTIDGVDININNKETSESVTVLNGAGIYFTDATIEVKCSGTAVPMISSSIMLSKTSIQGKKTASDTSWQTAKARKINDLWFVFCIGDEDCQSFRLTPRTTQLETPRISGILQPGKVTAKVQADKKQLKVSWKPVADAKGYQISYKQSGKSARTVFAKASAKSKKIRSLKSGKKYTVKVRAYKIYNEKKIYGDWSKAKTVRVK